MNIIIDTIAWISMILGVLLLLISMIGVYRFPDAFTKAHAASLIDTGGSFFIFLALALENGFNWSLFKIGIIVLFLWFASAINGHLLMKASIKFGYKPTPEYQPTLENSISDEEDGSQLMKPAGDLSTKERDV